MLGVALHFDIINNSRAKRMKMSIKSIWTESFMSSTLEK